MIFYFVQSASGLSGSDGYSFGLVQSDGDHLLVSFVDYMKKKEIRDTLQNESPERRRLVKRKPGGKKTYTRRA